MQNNERRDGKKEADNLKESGGVVPGDTIAQALDPFGSAAGPISVENSENNTKENSTKDDNRDRE